MLDVGVDCPRNEAEAGRWRQKAARQGHRKAQASAISKSLNSNFSAHGETTYEWEEEDEEEEEEEEDEEEEEEEE